MTAVTLRNAGWLLASAFLLLTPGCDSIENHEGPYEEIAGLYEAVIFTEPGAHDGGVDIIAAGGQLTLRLEANGEMSGHIVIPSDIESNYAPISAQIQGRFDLEIDTVYFQEVNPAGALPFNEAEWKSDRHEIESFDFQGHMASFKVVLKRQ